CEGADHEPSRRADGADRRAPGGRARVRAPLGTARADALGARTRRTRMDRVDRRPRDAPRARRGLRRLHRRRRRLGARDAGDLPGSVVSSTMRRGFVRAGGPLLAILAVALFVSESWRPHAQLDDAYISYRYARNLVEGVGLVYNPGEYVEGF